MSVTETLKQYIHLLINEARLREVDISDGTKVASGSEKHIKDLEVRISDLSKWRDKQKKGSEARANYARLIARLKAELKSAQRIAAKKNEK